MYTYCEIQKSSLWFILFLACPFSLDAFQVPKTFVFPNSDVRDYLLKEEGPQFDIEDSTIIPQHVVNLPKHQKADPRHRGDIHIPEKEESKFHSFEETRGAVVMDSYHEEKDKVSPSSLMRMGQQEGKTLGMSTNHHPEDIEKEAVASVLGGAAIGAAMGGVALAEIPGLEQMMSPALAPVLSGLFFGNAAYTAVTSGGIMSEITITVLGRLTLFVWEYSQSIATLASTLQTEEDQQPKQNSNNDSSTMTPLTSTNPQNVFNLLPISMIFMTILISGTLANSTGSQSSSTSIVKPQEESINRSIAGQNPLNENKLKATTMEVGSNNENNEAAVCGDPEIMDSLMGIRNKLRVRLQQ